MFSTCSVEDQREAMMPLAIMSSVLGGPTVTGDGMCWDGPVLGSPSVQSSSCITDNFADLEPLIPSE